MYIKNLREKIGSAPILSVACGAIIENEKEEILLQFRSDTKNFGIPGGNIELDETLVMALKREILEETGIIIDENTISLFGIYSGDKCITKYPNGDIVHYVIVVFYTKINSDTELTVDKNESEFLEFFARDDLPMDKLKESDSIWIKKWQKGIFQTEID